jgi:hypothetical protein
VPSDDETLRIKRRATVDLMNLDERVYGVGLGGYVDAAGHPTGELAIWVLALFAPGSGLPPIRQVVPPLVQGVRTHVVEMKKTEVEPHGKRVAGGSSIRGVRTGTLGIAARTAGVTDDKRPDVLLSCHHVLGDQPGSPVVQLSCSECCTPEVARVLRGVKRVDATIATINGEWEVDEGRIDGVKLAGISSVAPLLDWSELPQDALPALKKLAYEVHKYGAETGWTKGLVGCVDLAFRPGYSDTTVPSILIASSGKDAKAFSTYGDSGAVIIDGRHRVIALLNGGAQTVDEIGFTYAVPIQDVERELGIRVAASSASTWGAVVTPAPPGGPHRAPAGTASGRALLDMYGRHESEVRALLRDSRPFVVAWHRGRGPDLVAALTALAERRAEALPRTIEGRSWADRVAELSAALRGLGSPALARDLDRFAPVLAGLGGRTYDEVLAAVGGLTTGLEAAP